MKTVDRHDYAVALRRLARMEWKLRDEPDPEPPDETQTLEDAKRRLSAVEARADAVIAEFRLADGAVDKAMKP